MGFGTYLIEGVNPEPWRASEGSVGRKNGRTFVMFHKPAGLVHYQQAIQEEFKLCYPDVKPVPLNEYVHLEFFFWRDLYAYEGDKKYIQRNRADVTNMQKALEDALQGILYENDRQVQAVKSVSVEQMPGIEPKILIRMQPARTLDAEWATTVASKLTRPKREVVIPEQAAVNDIF